MKELVYVVTTQNGGNTVDDVVRAFRDEDKATEFVALLKELCHKGIKITEREIE
jgi:hypothetical protein